MVCERKLGKTKSEKDMVNGREKRTKEEEGKEVAA